jgi:hypothetical protein
MTQQLPLPDESDIARAQAEAEDIAGTGRKTFSTLLASASGSLVSIDIYETQDGCQLHLGASGNGRRMQPLIFDAYQSAALAHALGGAIGTMAKWEAS